MVTVIMKVDLKSQILLSPPGLHPGMTAVITLNAEAQSQQSTLQSSAPILPTSIATVVEITTKW